MSLDIPGVRPALIVAELRDLLSELRKFRHFFRNVYDRALDPKRVAANLGLLRAAHELRVQAIRGFLRWLDDLVALAFLSFLFGGALPCAETSAVGEARSGGMQLWKTVEFSEWQGMFSVPGRPRRRRGGGFPPLPRRSPDHARVSGCDSRGWKEALGAGGSFDRFACAGRPLERVGSPRRGAALAGPDGRILWEKEFSRHADCTAVAELGPNEAVVLELLRPGTTKEQLAVQAIPLDLCGDERNAYDFRTYF